ncbi:MAG: hypothetical protein ACI87W_001786 [Halieaceae bacterium]|jgi:uncharacterized protein (DUF1330 family)
MPAYMIVLARVHDREQFLAGYAAQAAQLVEEHGGRYVLRAPHGQVLEGDLDEDSSVVISEWPDMDSARRFWESDAYRSVVELRRGICDARVLLVEGELAGPVGGSSPAHDAEESP